MSILTNAGRQLFPMWLGVISLIAAFALFAFFKLRPENLSEVVLLSALIVFGVTGLIAFSTTILHWAKAKTGEDQRWYIFQAIGGLAFTAMAIGGFIKTLAN